MWYFRPKFYLPEFSNRNTTEEIHSKKFWFPVENLKSRENNVYAKVICSRQLVQINMGNWYHNSHTINDLVFIIFTLICCSSNLDWQQWLVALATLLSLDRYQGFSDLNVSRGLFAFLALFLSSISSPNFFSQPFSFIYLHLFCLIFYSQQTKSHFLLESLSG